MGLDEVPPMEYGRSSGDAARHAGREEHCTEVGAGIDELVRRAEAAPGLRALFLTCPGAVLRHVPTTSAEIAALRSGDQQQVEALDITAASARRWTALDRLA